MSDKIPLEYDEQKEVISWFDSTYRQYKALLFAIPNGSFLAGDARMRTIQASKLKRAGQRNGVPDLMLPIPSHDYHGLFIEMKRIKGGVISMEQKRWIESLNNNGYLAVVCNGADEAKTLINQYLSNVAS